MMGQMLKCQWYLRTGPMRTTFNAHDIQNKVFFFASFAQYEYT